MHWRRECGDFTPEKSSACPTSRCSKIVTAENKAECQRKQYTEQNSGNALHQKQRNRVIKPIQIAVSAQQLIGAQ